MVIVETGSIIPGATSYVSVDDFRLYATSRGVVLPVSDDEAAALLLKAVDFMESYSGKFLGDRVTREQPLSWPRKGAVIENWPWAETEIPRQVLNAQLALAIEINAGEDPFNPPANLPVVGETVGPISVQYANPGTAQKVAKTSPSQTIIKTLIRNSGLFLIRS
jgi:hypothetical protein